ncbi:lantibiotic dehydratase, partial [Nonomuraea sp. K274]|nr:lantibiotic dehydratase [Nonomuraea cypriaca]
MEVGREIVVRSAGLPAAVLADLRLPHTAELVTHLTVESRRLAAEAAALSDVLFELIGRAGTARAALVGLRRALAPGHRPPSARLLALCPLPEPVAERVAAWMRARRHWDERRAELAGVLAKERTDALDRIRAACADPVFRRGLLLSGEELSGTLDRWLADPDRPPRQGKVLRLVKYLARASAKTSPFGSFMVSALTTWPNEPLTGWSADAPDAGRTGDAPSPLTGWSGDAQGALTGSTGDERGALIGRPGDDLGALDPTAVSELPGAFLDAVRDALLADPRLADRLPVRPNPSLTEIPGALLYVREGPGERIVTSRRAPAVDLCLRLATASRYTVPRLAELLAEAGAELGEARRFVARLVAARLLVPCAPVTDDDPDPFGSWARWLAASELGEPSTGTGPEVATGPQPEVPTGLGSEVSARPGAEGAVAAPGALSVGLRAELGELAGA